MANWLEYKFQKYHHKPLCIFSNIINITQIWHMSSPISLWHLPHFMKPWFQHSFHIYQAFNANIQIGFDQSSSQFRFPIISFTSLANGIILIFILTLTVKKWQAVYLLNNHTTHLCNFISFSPPFYQDTSTKYLMREEEERFPTKVNIWLVSIISATWRKQTNTGSGKRFRFITLWMTMKSNKTSK